MGFYEYQELARATAGAYKRELSSGDAERIGAALAVAGEAGELADLIKKHVFHGHDIDPREIGEEIGDVLWGLAKLCDAYGLDLGNQAARNIYKLSQRYPDGFSEQASRERSR
jgi:NTP pyrophosphatase (non-canonical NTP hydrolase)